MRMTGREMPCDHMVMAHTQRGRGAAEVRCRERIRYQLAALLSHRIQGPTALRHRGEAEGYPRPHQLHTRTAGGCIAALQGREVLVQGLGTVRQEPGCQCYILTFSDETSPQEVWKQEFQNVKTLKILTQPFLPKDAAMGFASVMHAAPDQ